MLTRPQTRPSRKSCEVLGKNSALGCGPAPARFRPATCQPAAHRCCWQTSPGSPGHRSTKSSRPPRSSARLACQRSCRRRFVRAAARRSGSGAEAGGAGDWRSPLFRSRPLLTAGVVSRRLEAIPSRVEYQQLRGERHTGCREVGARGQRLAGRNNVVNGVLKRS